MKFKSNFIGEIAKYSTILCVSLLIYPVVLLKAKDKIVICGKWDSWIEYNWQEKSKLPPGISLYEKYTPSGRSNNNVFYEFKFEQDSFFLEIPITKPFVYVGFSNFGLQYDEISVLGHFYLLQSGDSIHVHRLNERDIKLSSDEPLPKCQIELKTKVRIEAGINEQRSNGARLKFYLGILEPLLNDVRSILSPYEGKLDPYLYELVRENHHSDVKSILCRWMLTEARLMDLSAIIENDFFNTVSRIYAPLQHVPDQRIINDSFKYLEFLVLYNAARGVMEARREGIAITDRDGIFAHIYDIIKKEYNVPLRDHILLETFKYLVYARFSENSGEKYLKDALTFVHDEEIRSEMEEMLGNVSNANIISEYTFYTMNDSKVKLSEYRGKVIIAHFWFKGCVPCRQLTKNLTPIVDTYKSNSNVVFLNINVDKRKEVWASGLESGDYNHSNEVLLYTGGVGMTHPLLKYFAYAGVPQLLIIGKGGTVVSPVAPRASNENEYKALVKMLEETLAMKIDGI